MGVRFSCPACSQTLKLDAPRAAGKKVRCSSCKHVFPMPVVGLAGAPSAPKEAFKARTTPNRTRPAIGIASLDDAPQRLHRQREAVPPAGHKKSLVRLSLLTALLLFGAAGAGGYYWHLQDGANINVAAQHTQVQRQAPVKTADDPPVTEAPPPRSFVPAPPVEAPPPPTTKSSAEPPPKLIPAAPPERGALTPRSVELTVRKRAERLSVKMRLHSRIKILEGEAAGAESSCVGTYDLQEEIRVPAPKEGDQLVTLQGGRITHAIDGKDLLLSRQWENFVQRMAPAQAFMQRDDQGSILHIALKERTIEDERLQLLHERVMQNLEVMAIPLVSQTLKPGQSWRASRPIPIPPLGEGPPVGRLELEFRYQGTRKLTLERPAEPAPKEGDAPPPGLHDQEVILLGLAGTVVGKAENILRPEGTITGEAWVSRDTGTVYLADLRIDMKIHRSDQDRSVLTALERIHLSLVRDNVAPLPGAALPPELLGRWSLVKEVRSGAEVPPRLGEESWWIFEPQGVAFGNDRGVTHATVRASPRSDVAPHAIDIGLGQGQGAAADPGALGLWLPCSYDVSGNTLKLCINYRSAARPSQFRSDPDSGMHLLIFERVVGSP